MEDEQPKRVIGRPFQPGQGGRKKGARNKLGEAFLETIAKDFAEHGEAAVIKVRETDPSTYMRVIAGLLPKELELTGAEGGPMQVTEIRRVIVDPKVG